MSNFGEICSISKVYYQLLELHGCQGWWPISGQKAQNSGTYHPGDFSYPRNDYQRFEISVGAILTQNSAWSNVELAIGNLIEADLMSADKILECDLDQLKEAIRPSGYYNQKAKKLLVFSQFFLEHIGKEPSRDDLLQLWGIGPETADSILLYAYAVPTFVVDAYTRRIFEALNLVEPQDSYDVIKKVFEKNLPQDFKIYQEYHALIVAHAKQFFRKKSGSEISPLLS